MGLHESLFCPSQQVQENDSVCWAFIGRRPAWCQQEERRLHRAQRDSVDAKDITNDQNREGTIAETPEDEEPASS